VSRPNLDDVLVDRREVDNDRVDFGVALEIRDRPRRDGHQTVFATIDDTTYCPHIY